MGTKKIALKRSHTEKAKLTRARPRFSFGFSRLAITFSRVTSQSHNLVIDLASFHQVEGGTETSLKLSTVGNFDTTRNQEKKRKRGKEEKRKRGKEEKRKRGKEEKKKTDYSHLSGFFSGSTSGWMKLMVSDCLLILLASLMAAVATVAVVPAVPASAGWLAGDSLDAIINPTTLVSAALVLAWTRMAIMRIITVFILDQSGSIWMRQLCKHNQSVSISSDPELLIAAPRIPSLVDQS